MPPATLSSLYNILPLLDVHLQCNQVCMFIQFSCEILSISGQCKLRNSTRDVWVGTSCNTVAAFPAGPKKVKDDQIQHSSSVQIGAIW